MSIPTQMSLVGFIASDPDLHFTSAGAEYLRLRVGIEQWRKEADGSFTKLDPTFHDMVAFESTARETYAQFRKGDSFVASGYVHEKRETVAGGRWRTVQVFSNFPLTDDQAARLPHQPPAACGGVGPVADLAVLPGHRHVLEDPAGRRAGTDRAGRTMLALRAVAGPGAVEPVALPDAGETLAL